MAIQVNGKDVQPADVAEFIFDYGVAFIGGAFVWALTVTDGPLKENWFGIALSIGVTYGLVKLLRKHKMFGN